MLNMRFLGLVIMSMMVLLQFYGANAATGYKPSQFQEDKGDFSARPKGGPFQRTEGDRAKWRDYQKDESKATKRKSQRGGESIALWIIIPLVVVLFLLISSGFFINNIIQVMMQRLSWEALTR